MAPRTLIWIVLFVFCAAVFLRLGDPFHGCGVVLSRVCADYEDAIGVLQVYPVIGHGTPAIRVAETGNCSGVSYTRLVFYLHQTQCPR